VPLTSPPPVTLPSASIPGRDENLEKTQVSPDSTGFTNAATRTITPEPGIFEIDEEWFGGALEAQRSRLSPTAVVTASVARAPMTPPNMADSFHALLAEEQGGAAAPAPIEPVLISEDVIEQIASRVAQRLSEGVFVETVRRVVEEVAERLVREEIARIRAKVDAQKPQ
jgi:hypothetical protein